jgi:Kef-type K+ transport system membrane component KefB
VAIILCATSLGVLVPVLKDAGEISSTLGQLIVAAASIADFGAIILLSIGGVPPVRDWDATVAAGLR